MSAWVVRLRRNLAGVLFGEDQRIHTGRLAWVVDVPLATLHTTWRGGRCDWSMRLHSMLCGKVSPALAPEGFAKSAVREAKRSRKEAVLYCVDCCEMY